MARPLAQAWNSLQSGRIQEAQEGFRGAIRSQSDPGDGFLGLAATGLAAGNLTDALSFAQRSLEQSPSPEAHLLAGEVQSRLGNRRQAEEHLEAYFSAGGSAPYARALLGEQRIRTARWEDGLEAYVQALSEDVDGRAIRQFKGVMSDLTAVVNEGRLPPRPARKFVDRLERRLAHPPPGAPEFFDSVRQALDNGRSMTGPPDQDAILDLVGQRQLPEATDPETDPPSADSMYEPEDTEKDAGEGSGIDPKQKDLAGVIQKDRRENEQLQEAIGAMPPPDWPSAPEYGTIDPLPRMNWAEQSIFAGDPGIDSTDFRITSGNVRAEIFLERCLQSLLAGASQNRAVTVRFRPEAITRLEVNCWDGLLDRLPELSSIYEEFHEAEDYGMLAVGRFIGECVATPYDGTWDFADPPEDSKLIIGNTTLDPFAVARDWRKATDQDEVDLEQLAEQARRAARDSSSLTVEQNYIDPTRELEGQSLGVKLAELWAGYLFRLAEASFANLAETIEPQEVGTDLIVFSLDAEYCPARATGPDGASFLEGGGVPVAYRRDSGQFLLLASRKHAARALQLQFDDLNGETAPDIVQFLADYHRPRWQFVGNQSAASSLSSRSGTEFTSPTLTETQDGTQIEIDTVADGTATRLLLHAPTRDAAWKIETTTHA